MAQVRKALSTVVGSGAETDVGAVGTMRTYEAYEITRGNQAVLGRVVDRYAEERLAADIPALNVRRERAAEDAATARRQVQEDARLIVARADAESRRFLAALSDVVKGLRAVDGRKAVILFSEGFEIDNVTHELEDVAAAAARSFAVVYSMHIGDRGPTETDETARGGEWMMEVRSRAQPLGSLAAETDGALFADADSQLDRALGRVAEASQDYYLVGFEPGSSSTESRYQRVEVKVKRPGARVSARHGYALGPPATPADRRAAVEGALRAPFSQQGLKVEYSTYVLRGSNPDVQRVLVSLAADLPVAGAGETRQADVIFTVRSVADGRTVASGSDSIPLPDATRPGDGIGRGVYRVQFEVPAGTYMMRAVVREPGGLLGSADRRFQVRPLRGPGVTASDLVLGSADVRGLPVRATVYTAEALPAMLEVYGRTTTQLANASVAIELLPVGSGQAARTIRAELREPEPVVTGFSRAAEAMVPLEGVSPGEYIVRAVVRDGAESVAELLRDVRIVAGAPPPSAPPTRPEIDPRRVFGGDVGRRYLASLQSRLGGSPLGPAAAAAAAGDWAAVAAALPSGATLSGDAQVLSGLAALGRGQFQAAASTLGPAVEREAPSADLAFLVGWAHAGAGDDRKAVGAWRAAILADPALIPAYLALADLYERLGSRPLARQVVENGLKAVPGSAELADWLSRLGTR